MLRSLLMIRSDASGGGCCGGIYGAPPISEQAPPSYARAIVPLSAHNNIVRVGTRVNSEPPRLTVRPSAIDPITAKPVYPVPASAGPTGDHVPTTSALSGDNPGPIPPVGTISPQAGTGVASTCVAPSSSWGSLALIAGGIILFWILAGIGLRRLL